MRVTIRPGCSPQLASQQSFQAAKTSRTRAAINDHAELDPRDDMIVTHDGTFHAWAFA